MEQADAALAGVAVEMSTDETVEDVLVVTTDGPAATAIARTLADIRGVDATVLDGFAFVDWLDEEFTRR